MLLFRISFSLLVLLTFSGGLSQRVLLKDKKSLDEIVPNGYFIDRKLEIGIPLRYSLSIQYPAELDVLFPDSTYNFGQFEYTSKRYFPTKIIGDELKDSVIYELMSFEIDSVQGLTLPVFLILGGDSIESYSVRDSLMLNHLISGIDESSTVRSNTEALDLVKAINTPYIIVGGTIGIVLLIVAYFIFGKRVRQYFKIRKLRREYIKFSDKFSQTIGKLNKSKTRKTTEDALLIWKTYLEKLDNQPYTKLTSKEMLSNGIEPNLGETLRTIDRSIYGRVEGQDLLKSFERLEDYSLEQYQKKLDEVKAN